MINYQTKELGFSKKWFQISFNETVIKRNLAEKYSKI